MRRVDPTTVLVVPWYEREDFEKLRLVNQGQPLPLSYNAWLDSAFSHMRQQLAQGCALKIVTIHLDDYFTWLASEGELDSAKARQRYEHWRARDASHAASARFGTVKADGGCRLVRNH